MRSLFAVTIVVSCAIDHHVTILLGPSASEPSTGFQCKDPDMTSQLLLARGYSNGLLHFTLVVDVIDLGGQFPNCLAEDIVSSCKNGSCALLATSQRFCRTLTIPITNLANAAQQVTTDLDENYTTIITSTPHRPVIVRAAITTDPDCPAMTTAQGGQWPTLRSDATHTILGCAYSCPAVLDDVGSTITLGLDIGLSQTSNDTCVQAIDACATFPD